MKHLITWMAASALLWACGSSRGQESECLTWEDPGTDAEVRRTDHGNDGVLDPSARPPEVLAVTLCPWEAFDPAADRYTGRTVDSDDAHLFRVDIVFAGVVNPPGPLGLNGDPFDPHLYGPSPLVGFLDIDVDDDRNTGGELGGAAEIRYLANVARFARVPKDSLAARAAKSRADLDGAFYTPPQYERSGEDFALVLCGCFTPAVVELAGDGDGIFEPGESWLAIGRFFERAQGYREASAAYNGSAPGLYDPILEVRFDHDEVRDETTVTLVWALDPDGAAALAGEPEEFIDLDVSNQTCVVEALQDIIDGANGGGVPVPAWELVRGWRGRNAWDHTDVSDWRAVTGLFGLPYALPESTLYAWTDSLGDESADDLNGDEQADDGDEALVRAEIFARDGGMSDADGAVNGTVVIRDPGWDFSLFDTDGNMALDLFDQAPYGPLGDFNGSGAVDIQDFLAFLNAWAARLSSADFNLDQSVDIKDFLAFLNAWVLG